MNEVWRLRGFLVIALALASCRHGDDFRDPPMPALPAPTPFQGTISRETLVAPRWDAALVAGDTTLHVDDDAVMGLEQQLQSAGIDIERLHGFSADKQQFVGGVEGSGIRGDDDLSRNARRGGRDTDSDSAFADERPRPGATEPARPALVLRTLMALQGRRAGACLAYFASKPDDDDLTLFEGSLSAAELDQALDAGCGTAPTVVIVSGCASGAFAAPPMTRANRLILTAAARGQHGFGCGPNQALTTFDECLLGALPASATWVEAFDRTKRCVRRREQVVEQPDVGPQSVIGAAAAGLTVPRHAANAADDLPPSLSFRQGIGRFTTEDVPYFSTLKARTHAAFDGYAHAPIPKAMALTLAGTVAWNAGHNGETPDDVARIALQRCEWQSSGGCILYARDMSLAALSPGGVPIIHAALLARTGLLTAADTPFIRTDQRPEIQRYLALPQPKVLALGPDTESIGGGTGATPEAARQAALQKCGTGCVVFAEGNQIVLGYL